MARKPAKEPVKRRSRKAATKKPAAKKAETEKVRRGPVRRLLRWVWRGGIAAMGFALLATFFYAMVNPPTTPYMFSEGRRLDASVDQQWVPIEEISPFMARSVVAAEDANFCLHWGFDMAAIRDAIAAGARRGGSTISQQTVKNAYLWQGRSWTRKALEAVMTPLVELVWTKRRILEVYLNVAEFDEGVFGVEAASRHYFGVGPEELSARQAARLAAVLPNPKNRSASNPTSAQRRRAAGIADGAATILADGRAACFEP